MSKIANHLRTFAIAVFSLLTGSAFVATEAHYFANDGKLILPDAYTRWCATRGNTIGAHVNSDFRITIPQPKARYQVDPVLPAFQQMVELTAASASDVEWFVNGASLRQSTTTDAFASSPPASGRCAPSVARTSPSKRLSSKASATSAFAFCSIQHRRFVRLGTSPELRCAAESRDNVLRSSPRCWFA